MVYYIRYLKTPRIQKQNGSVSISALICITTDLGDSFLAEDVDLMVTAREETSRIVYEKPTKWNAYNRELPITLGPLPVNLAQKTLVLTVQTPPPKPLRSTERRPLRSTERRPLPPFEPLAQPYQLVMGAISAPFSLQSTHAEALVKRHMSGLVCGPPLQIWEETGNSIARHIWDAGLATVAYLSSTLDELDHARKVEKGDAEPKIIEHTRNEHKIVGSKIPALKKILSITRNSPIQVVELGAGCGIVGIGLVQMLANCSVLLTDLPEVEDIITRNINASHPATMSSVKYRNLDWGNPPDDLCSCPIELILVSDCTYNEDSLPVLVSALDRLVRTSPDAVILVALKRRHDSETKFFDLMASAGFMSEMESMELPSQHGEVDKIEFHCYSRQL